MGCAYRPTFLPRQNLSGIFCLFRHFLPSQFLHALRIGWMQRGGLLLQTRARQSVAIAMRNAAILPRFFCQSRCCRNASARRSSVTRAASMRLHRAACVDAIRAMGQSQLSLILFTAAKSETGWRSQSSSCPAGSLPCLMRHMSHQQARRAVKRVSMPITIERRISTFDLFQRSA